MAAAENSESITPVYVPWKSFEGYLATLKGSTIPHQLDGTIRPKSMAGGLWRQLVSAFKFLGLVDNNGIVNEKRLPPLVQAHGTDKWAEAVKQYVIPAYRGIIGDLPIATATPGQLRKKFQDGASVDGQMQQKCIRFYLHALKMSGIKYSDHLLMRESSSASRPRKKKAATKINSKGQDDKKDDVGGDSKGNSELPAGMIDFPIPMGDKPGFIRVRADLTIDQFPIVEAMLNAVKVLAETNSKRQPSGQ